MHDSPDIGATVMLSVQRALLGEVTAALRGVTVGWEGNRVEIRCYFDGPIPEDEQEAMRRVQTEVIADLPESADVRLEVERCDAPCVIAPLRAWVYRRRE